MWSYKPKWVKQYEKSIYAYIKSTGYKRKLTGALRITKLEYTFPIKDRRLWGKLKTTRPDLMDNLQKLPMDVLTKVGLIEDDSHIAECLLLRKKYGEKENIELHIEEIDDSK